MRIDSTLTLDSFVKSIVKKTQNTVYFSFHGIRLSGILLERGKTHSKILSESGETYKVNNNKVSEDK
jgi:hypothetical protein